MTGYPHFNQSPFFRTFSARPGVYTARTRGPIPYSGTPYPGARPNHPTQMPLSPLTNALVSPGWQQQRTAAAGDTPVPNTPENLAPAIPQPAQIPQTPMIPQNNHATGMPRAAEPRPPTGADSPQTQAEHILQLNKGLPDGVRYEPIDKETQAALEALKNGTLGQSAPEEGEEASLVNSPVSVEAPPATTETPQNPVPLPVQAVEAVEPVTNRNRLNFPLLEKLIQDEHNSALFYKNLAAAAPSGLRDKIAQIAADCAEHQKFYQKMLQTGGGTGQFSPKEIKISAISFRRGLEIAVVEETKILESMAELLDNLQGTHLHSVQNQLNKRLIRLGWLQWLRGE